MGIQNVYAQHHDNQHHDDKNIHAQKNEKKNFQRILFDFKKTNNKKKMENPNKK